MTRTLYVRREPNPRRALLGAFLVSVYAVLLLAPLAVAFADPRLDHVEDELGAKLPGYQRYVEPSTQPSEPPVIDPPVLDPLPPLPDDPFSPVAYPSLPANRVGPGGDLAKLTKPSTLVDGEYTTSGDIRQNAVAEHPGKATLRLKAKQTPQLPDVFAGVVVDGGGLPDNDDLTKCGTHAGFLVHSCTFRNSEGFGLLINKGGVRVTECTIADNGSGGIGGTTNSKTENLIDRCRIERNNLKWKRTNSNKVTRMKVTFYLCSFDGNAGRDVWADNYTQLLRILKCKARNAVTDKSGDPWKAGDFAAELTDQFIVKDCDVVNDVGGCIYVNEVMLGTVIEGNSLLGKSGLSIELRDLARGTPFHTLRGVVIRGNVLAGKVAPSGAGNKIGLGKNRISVEASNSWPGGDGKPRVTVKN